MSSALLLLASGGIGHNMLMFCFGAVCGATFACFIAAWCMAAGRADERNAGMNAYSNGVAMGLSVHGRRRRIMEVTK